MCIRDRFKFDDVDFPINLNSTDKELFKSIYREFSENIDHPTLNNEINFKHYFQANEGDFLEKILKLQTEEKVEIKYYYLLSLIHIFW